MTPRRRLGLSTRLALVVAGGLTTIQALVMAVALYQATPPPDGSRHPFLVRVVSIVSAVESAPTDRREVILDSVSNPEVAFSLAPQAVPPGYVLDRSFVVPGLHDAGSDPRESRRITMLLRRSALPGLGDLRLRGMANRAMTVALRDGGFLLAEPVGPRRRQGTLFVILLTNLIVGVAVVSAVWMIARGLVSPLEVIAARARTFATDSSGPPMREDIGSPEARDLAEAFNVLRADIDRLLDARMRMLAAVAHDLRTYLTRLQLRLGGLQDADQRAAADNTVRRMSALIDDVLLAARAEQAAPSLEAIDLGSVLNDIVEDRLMLGQAVEMESQPPRWIESDLTSLSRALENLIENAVRHGGGARIMVRPSPASIDIHIIDHGPGLPPEIDPNALEPFITADRARNRDEAGVGLGLYIARTLIERIGGRLLFRETVGGGLTCVVSLPEPEVADAAATLSPR